MSSNWGLDFAVPCRWFTNHKETRKSGWCPTLICSDPGWFLAWSHGALPSTHRSHLGRRLGLRSNSPLALSLPTLPAALRVSSRGC
eukprot:s1658_g13.t1